MWRCKECGGEVVEVEKETIATKFRIDKHMQRVVQIGNEYEESTSSIYECKNCAEVAFYESDIEDIAEWEED